MKTIFAGVIALGLLTGTAAMADQRAHNGSNNGYQNQQQSQQLSGHNQKTVVRTVTKTKTTYKQARVKGEYVYKGKSYRSVKTVAWRAPRGYDAHQTWHRGQRLPAAYRARNYYVDYRANHLERPAYGYEWVRVRDHAYLVKQHDGLVVQIVWNMFN